MDGSWREKRHSSESSCSRLVGGTLRGNCHGCTDVVGDEVRSDPGGLTTLGKSHRILNIVVQYFYYHGSALGCFLHKSVLFGFPLAMKKVRYPINFLDYANLKD